MSFYSVIERYSDFDIEEYFSGVTENMVLSSMRKENLSSKDFLNLLSPAALPHLEEMARKANKLTVQHFGRTISLYAPLYISNYCTNHCTYCGFSVVNKIKRAQLTLEEIDREAAEMAKTGLKHILLLTGEAKGITEISYLADAIKVLKKYFSSVALEVFPMDEEEYRILKEAGADSLTIYQEVYDRDIYREVHLKGGKADYRYRLDTPERGAKAGLRAVNVGALFGLGELASEAFYSGLHAKYLMDKYLETEVSISLPRINPAEGGFQAKYTLGDRRFVQFILAYRLFLPKVGINLSTRETEEFRDNLLKLGITKFSAGSKTTVGGYNDKNQSTEQFDTSDKRSVEEIVAMIRSQGYQVVYKDWEAIW
ncbi:thiamine biosynthesis protein ThiH [Propionigenium maris DSM 9537]|uniref:Thiamine biosynthesis protein ThiH n=1 Tax=Propionigenium maris DSM 9537 TaxID=1123000 RepID=A0A9W6GK84_9FUSO|nr:2-iminoacetate synthase ThiH [Propionigenium maris]GLI55690.1 thiamine biosynthesis protein ThiH [Propionigenium maris DSM 9537]